MPDDIDSVIKRIEKNYLGKPPEKYKSRIIERVSGLASKFSENVGDYFSKHKKILGIGALCFVIGATGTYLLAKDFITKRQAFPVRNVLYQAQETIFVAGGEETRDVGRLDTKSETIIQKGNPKGTKLGDLVGLFKVRAIDEQTFYELEDQNKTRIAFASEKHELIQAGLRVSGATDFAEIYAEILGKPGKFIRYSFTPERGLRNIEFNVLEDVGGNRTLVNELVTHRMKGLGWFLGINYRSGTELNEFPASPKNKRLTGLLFENIRRYDRTLGLTKSEREGLVKQILTIEQQLEKIPVFVSHEDGFLKILPQESSTYLFGNPGFFQRLKLDFDFFKKSEFIAGNSKYPTWKSISDYSNFNVNNPNGDIVKIRIENSWDLMPGNYFFLNQIAIGTHPNILRPFAHYNNGGYTIKDDAGDMAKIVIQDFWFHYGDDVLYKYYLDKNGDGKIDLETELIGSVLYRTSQDEKADLHGVFGEGSKKRDVTKRHIYTFMAGHDWDRRREEFYLCNTIESFIMNEINRGFGKHSDIGSINNQRSNILLRENSTVPNLARALTPESSLVAKNDIVALFRAAGRSYIDKYISAQN
jgi:hypothetical protein